MQHLPGAHWGPHQPAAFPCCLWNPCSCCAFPGCCLQVWVGTVKQCQPQKIKTPRLWKTGLGLWFPNSLYLLWGVLHALYCQQNKQCWEEEFWRASHILSITTPKGQSWPFFPFNLAGEERQLAPSNISQRAIWLRIPGTVLFPTSKQDFTRYMANKGCLQSYFQIRTHFRNYTAS